MQLVKPLRKKTADVIKDHWGDHLQELTAEPDDLFGFEPINKSYARRHHPVSVHSPGNKIYLSTAALYLLGIETPVPREGKIYFEILKKLEGETLRLAIKASSKSPTSLQGTRLAGNGSGLTLHIGSGFKSRLEKYSGLAFPAGIINGYLVVTFKDGVKL